MLLHNKYSDIRTANIIFDGNSIVDSGLPFGSWGFPGIAISILNMPKITWYNFGIAGQNTDRMTANAAAKIDTQIKPNVLNILVAWEILNTIQGGATARSAVDQFWAYTDARKAAGWKVVVLTPIPFYNLGSPASINTRLVEAKNLLIAENSTRIAKLIDLTTYSQLGNMIDLTNPNSDYIFDNINSSVHLTVLGKQFVAQVVAKELLTISI